ncbi:MAG: hypothetical protein M5U22_14840 [Thermoleophilia bacterium]|nr:hypothetical protein [Thermoleophilia bacterium]
MTRTRSSNGSRLLGDILAEKHAISEDQLRRALSYQKETGAKLGEALIKLGYITDEHLAEALASQKKLPIIPLGELMPNPRAVALLTEKFIRSRQVLPVDFDRDALVLAMVNPLDVLTLDDVRVITRHEVVPAVATSSAFNEIVDYVFTGNRGSLGAMLETDLEEVSYRKVAEDHREADDQSVVSLVNDIIDSSLKRRASDIHFEPQLYQMTVRIRVDGVLQSLTEIPNDLNRPLKYPGWSPSDVLRCSAA